MPGILYVVATPIGNLGDLSPRARETLETVDFIAAEDTRVTVKLLSHFEIRTPLVSYHEHNLAERGAVIIDRILAGESCAITTDAGTPAISDPGAVLVAQARDAGIKTLALPGPCAAAAAYALSGFGTRFTFEGFLSVNRSSRREHLRELSAERRPMIFYEAPHKLRATLEDFIDTFGADRMIFIARELTKLYEENLYLTLGEAVRRFAEREPRGEFVLVVAGSAAREEMPLIDPLETARRYLCEGMSPADAARAAARDSGVSKNAIYRSLIGKEPVG